MSYATPTFPTPLFYWGCFAGEIQAILGGYKQGTFKHESLTKNDFSILNKGKELISSSLERIERLEKRVYFSEIDNSSTPLLDLELLISLSSAQTPSELKKELACYNDLLEKVRTKQSLAKDELNKTYRFFTIIAEKADGEYAKYASSEDDD